jgi:hypothetical protein
MLKSRGLKIDPCGTPEATTKGDKRIPETLTGYFAVDLV